LHIACSHGAPLEVVQALIEAWPVSCRVQDDDGYLSHPNKLFINDGKLQMIEFLLQPCLETPVTSNSGFLPLHLACRAQAATDVIQYLINLYPESVRVLAYDRLPLYFACSVDEWNIKSDDSDSESYEPDRWTLECLVRTWPESIMAAFKEKNGFFYRPFDIFLDTWAITATNKKYESSDGEYELSDDDIESLAKIPLLTNGIPPLHFVCTYSPSIRMLDFLKYLVRLFADDRLLVHDGMLPFHCACRAGAPKDVLEWWLKQYPQLAGTPLAETNDYPLHCYVSHVAQSGLTPWRKQEKEEYLSTVEYLVKAHPAALRIANRGGWLPLHLAAMNDAPLNVIFYLARQHPECMIPVIRVGGRKRTALCLDA